MGKIERVFHSVIFEVLALVMSITGLVIFTQHDMSTLSGTMIVVASMAMIWNYSFNATFDHYVKGEKTQRSLSLRIIHVLLFEAGLLFFTIPVMAFILDLSLWDAFVMDLGVTIFITIYAFVFNLSYDHLRAFIVKKRIHKNQIAHS
ncbi:PACE efflux transporter [Psychromonas arctica]|uniref:PACE efflux transporter n=1 Tax=Psychromonas arctica TaxID=168275 RepID=A0ABU9H9V8_9GAMM